MTGSRAQKEQHIFLPIIIIIIIYTMSLVYHKKKNSKKSTFLNSSLCSFNWHGKDSNSTAKK